MPSSSPSDEPTPTRPLEVPVAPSTSASVPEIQPIEITASEGADDVIADLRAAFGDRYLIGESLGEGGFGSVYRGFDRRLNRAVAVKAARTDQGPLADATRLTQEAQRVAQLRHPGIVSVQDVGIGGNRCFIVSELLAGPNLFVWLRQRLPAWSEAAGIAAAVADALAHAHARGIIHRDIKPSNIILLDGNRPVLVDFGISLSTSTPLDDLSLNAGTPEYMTPEQARGLGSRPDGRSDVYSLGATLFEMLVGRPPFQADDTQALLRLVRDAEPPRIRQHRADVPADLEVVCRRALAKQPNERFSTAQEFAAALRRVVHRTQVAVVSVPLEAPVSRTPVLISPPAERETPTHLPLPPERFTPPTVRRAESERRQVSILSATFESATGEDLEDAHEQFLIFQAAARAIVTGCEGRPLPTSGTMFQALFGYPTAREDGAHQAVRTALALVTRLARGACVRVAVNTGLAVVTESPDGTPTVIGDVTAGVARLSSVFAGTSVLVTEVTRKLIEGYFDCEMVGVINLRTDGTATPVHRVLAERSARNRVEAADPARLTPLIGRDREVELLRERWEQAREGHGHTVILVGDPGLGKSRLVHTLREHVQCQHGSAVLTWHGSAAAQHSPLHPITNYFNQVFEHETDADRRLDRLIRLLRQDGCDETERVALFAAALAISSEGRLARLNFSPERLRERICEVLIEWLRGLTHKQPLLFIVEDLHWVDPSTLEMLGRLVEQSHDLPLLAIFTARPEFEPAWKGKADQTLVALTRLSYRQVAELLRAQAGAISVPTEGIDRIAERSDGVPLFVEEFGRLLGENGLDATGSIPATLQDLLLARLDRMAADRELVQLAAAIDRTFSFALLLAASAYPEAVLRAELTRLVAEGLLFVRGSPPKETYTFKHALIQDAAYQSMVKKSRQQVHLRIAKAYEMGFPEIVDAQPELLAHHFAASGNTDRAIAYWLKAGQRSRERSAHRESLRHLSRGLEGLLALPVSAERDVRELEFRMPLAASFIATHGYASVEVEEHVTRAQAICDQVGPTAPRFHVLMVTWGHRFMQGRIEQAEKIARGLVGLAEVADEDGYRTEAHWAAGCTAWWAGDFSAAWRHLERADLLYRVDAAIEHARFTEQNAGPLLMAYAGLSLWTLGYIRTASEKLETALALAEDLKHPFTLAVTLWVQTLQLHLAGRSEAALDFADQVVALSEAQSFAFWAALGRGVKGAALTALGHAAEAVPLLRDSLACVEATGCQKFHQHTLHALAEALWRLGNRSEAWEALHQALTLNDRDKERFFEAELYRLKATFHLEDEPSNEYDATVALVRAIEIARLQGARIFELRAALALGSLCVTTQPRDARAFVEASLDGLGEGLDSTEALAAQAFLAEHV